MPVVANITAADPSTAPSAVTNMVDGDVVNANALVLQAVNPGPTNNPNLTLSFIWSYVLAACTSVVLAAFTGTSFSIAAGPLLTFLQLLANQAANLTKGNTFLGSGNTNTFQGSVTVNTNLFVGGTGTFNGAVGFGGSAPVTVDDTLTVDGLLTAAGGLSVAGVLESAGLTSAGPITGENGVVAADNFVVLNATGNLVSPITIDLSAAAVGVGGLSTGSWVLIFGGTGNTALNGTFQVTALDSTHVSLNGTMGNGTYNASSATIVIGPAVTVPTGYIQFTGTQPAPNQDPGGNNVAWAASLLKGWSNVVTDGAGNVTFTDPGSGLNSKVTASVASSSPYAVTITFARQMKAGTLPAVAYGVTNTGSGDACFATTQTKSATSFSFAVWDATSGAWFNMHGAPISVDCLIAGEQ